MPRLPSGGLGIQTGRPVDHHSGPRPLLHHPVDEEALAVAAGGVVAAELRRKVRHLHLEQGHRQAGSRIGAGRDRARERPLPLIP